MFSFKTFLGLSSSSSNAFVIKVETKKKMFMKNEIVSNMKNHKKNCFYSKNALKIFLRTDPNNYKKELPQASLFRGQEISLSFDKTIEKLHTQSLGTFSLFTF